MKRPRMQIFGFASVSLVAGVIGVIPAKVVGQCEPLTGPCTSITDCCDAGAVCDANTCCIADGSTGCTAAADCCTAGTSCEAGMCCSPNGVSCSTSTQCCNFTSTCDAITNTCCVQIGISGCTIASDCCTAGAACEAGMCCAPNGVTCFNDAQCCNQNANCDAGTCCIPDGFLGCTAPSDCCTPGTACEAGKCCAPNGIPFLCDDDADCCNENAVCGNNTCCIRSGDTGCTATSDCCQGAFGATCEAGKCCAPNGVPFLCDDDADCCNENAVCGNNTCCIRSGDTGCTVTSDCCDSPSGATCEGGVCGLFGACTTCCECTRRSEEDCAALGGEFHGAGVLCADIGFVPDTTPPDIRCPEPITLDRGDRLCALGAGDWLSSATATDDCGEPTVTTNAPECGFPYGSTTTVTFTATDECGNARTCTSEITIGPAPRVDMSKKGSLLAFSKVDLRWNAVGALTQDTFLTLTNDYPGDVYVQMYFVNGDLESDPIFSNTIPPVLLAEGEPGCNWVDCQLLLTPDQPMYWSAAGGDPVGCQPFAILDPDLGNGPGRPNPDAADGSRALRGYVLAWAVNEAGAEIQWNHLSGKATIVDYGTAAAWEYDAFAFQSGCRAQGDEPPDCTLFDEQGVCCQAQVIPGALGMDGFQYDYAFDVLLLDFFGVGSEALSGPDTSTTVDTDLTLHLLSADLRQETEGPITTKAHFDIWNMNERKLSNTRRCIECWDQTLLSQYGAPNTFLLDNLQSDKGKARIDGLQADECEENCFRDGIADPNVAPDNQTAGFLDDLLDLEFTCSQNAALLGLAAKHITFSGPAGQREVAGGNLAGMGIESAGILFDVITPPGSLRLDTYNSIGRDGGRGAERLGEPKRQRSTRE